MIWDDKAAIVRFPDGSEGELELICHKGAAAIVPLMGKLADPDPEIVLVHQYRSNVAFLMGDLELAEEALVAALRIEPGNALFAKNLENVRQKRAETAR